MACVGLAILVAYGIATTFDVMYNPIQSIMPFLLLGEYLKLQLGLFVDRLKS